MNDFIGNNIKFITEWGQLIIIVIIGLSLFALYLLGRRNRYYLPRGIMGYLGATLSVLVLLCASLIFARLTMVKPGVMKILNQLDSLHGEMAPSLEFRLVNNDSTHHIDQYRDHVVLLNFWATWCAPCIKELPNLNRLQEKYHDKGLRVIAISDESRDRLTKFMSKMPQQVIAGYVTSFDWVDLKSERPATFLISKEGVVEAYFTGSYDYEFFEEEVLKYL